MTTSDPEKKSTAPTREQRAAARADHDHHSRWLRERGIAEAVWPMGEENYTALILSGLLDPHAGAAVLAALLAGLPPRPAGTPVPAAAYAPSNGVDLVVPMRVQGRTELLIVEHKRFKAASHVPKGEENPNFDWQTDHAYEGATGLRSAPWLYGDLIELDKTCLVLDVYGRPMDRTFYDGLHNEKWTVTSYAQFGAVLRTAFERGVPGLVPLLCTLYIG
ncbi:MULTISPECIES: hypothetical protein [Streptacidiphilus]|uniref:NERD domain-containing protein n=1 Tax=Streptacidiphilus cavernicola TaxID=3342716 RepID=A0ABV6UW90_9ACTN|nr:hypothetical protein [Streptacidiphilus jeojiense]